MSTDNAKNISKGVNVTDGLLRSPGFCHLINTACKWTVKDVQKGFHVLFSSFTL